MAMGTKQTRGSVLMLPWLAHGHISPLLELAKKLSNRNFYIYFCSTPINLSSIKNKITDKYSLSIQLVELHLPSLPELPPHHHTTNGLPSHLMPTLKRAFKMAIPSLSNILKTLNPDLLIFDIVMQWAEAVASSHDLPAIQFLSSSAAMTSFFSHMFVNPGVEYPFPAIYLRDFEITKIREHMKSSSIDQEAKDSLRERRPERSCNIMLIKSFKEIERKYIDYFSVLLKKEIMPVGPLIEYPVDDDENMELIEWLSKKDQCSSVFVSFGSEYFLSKEEMEEIAHGLELSNVNFIWVVRFPVGEKIRVDEALPEGFLERVRERGVVVEGWAPQVKILGHSSVGGFVSHCGWNSIMESMKFGVPIIAMPMQLDQPLNARLLAEVGFGVEVMRDDNGMLHREEVAKVIREVVVENAGEEVRRKAKEWRENIRLRGEEGMEGVVEKLAQLCEKKKG